MSHSVKRSKSKNEQFRMVVPPDIRHLVGKTEWTESLGTRDPNVAAVKRGELIAFHKNEVLRLRGIVAHQPVQEALQLLDRGFDRLARIRGSIDAAIAEQLNLLASTVIDSWTPPGQFGEVQSWGDTFGREPLPIQHPVPGIDNDPDRDIFRLRASLLEGTGKTDGILYRRLAALLLERRTYKPIWFAVSYMTSVEPRLKLDRNDVYEAVAETYLTRLSSHIFTSWPAAAELAWEPILSIPGNVNFRSTAQTPQIAQTGPLSCCRFRGHQVKLLAPAARSPWG